MLTLFPFFKIELFQATNEATLFSLVHKTRSWNNLHRVYAHCDKEYQGQVML